MAAKISIRSAEKAARFRWNFRVNVRPIKSSQYEKFHLIVFLALVIDVLNVEG